MPPTQVKKMEEKKISAIGMDMIPRQVSRAQSFDALSSMANVAGYR
jgi:NAD/NADP transhydrogenase alpha subunit